MLARMRTLVVVPTYNEASGIETVLRRIREVLPEGEILVVDDNSPDGTAELVEAAGATDPGVSVMRRPAKTGLGSAYLAGFAEGLERGFDILVEMDADLSHDPSALPALVSAAAHGADVAIGSRYVAGGSTPDWTWRRAFLSRWGNRYAALALGLAVNDSTSGYRAYRADALAPGRPRPRPGLRLRLPGRDDVPAHQPGRPGGRDPGRLRRSSRGRVQDVAARSSSRPSPSSPAGACGTC